MLELFVLTALAQDPCPEGQERSEFTHGQCCWPGQAYNGKACVGIPKCPEGLRTLPDRCAKPSVRTKRKHSTATRNVMIASKDLVGQTIVIDGKDLGRMPLSVVLTQGVHDWAVVNEDGLELLAGEFKVRAGEGNQTLVVKLPEQ